MLLWPLLLAAQATLARTRQAGTTIKVSGTITDVKTGEPIAGAAVYAERNGNGAVTGRNGTFSLTVPAGNNTLIVTYLGYEKATHTFTSSQDIILRLPLSKASVQLSQVEVLGGRPADDNISNVQSGVTSLSINTIRKVPAFLGEVDVVKSLKLLPGVSSVGEAASGFNVRGGSIDQNLVLLDEAPIFNSSHLFGFFSVFNPGVIADVTLYRSGIPAQYGGRISSVLDVRQREGSFERFSVNGGIGLVSGRLAVEGPIVKDKTSFLIAGRRSYSNWLLHQVRDVSVRNSSANFYDISAKLSHRFGSRNRLSLSAYRSSDRFGFAADTLYGWSTTTGNLTYTHLFTDHLVLRLSGIMSKYDFEMLQEEPNNASRYSNGILYKSIKADFAYTSGKHQIDFGASSHIYTFRQGELEPNSGISQVLPVRLQQEHALESAIYWNDAVKLWPKLSVQYGVRYSFYGNYGAGEVYQYQPGEPKQERTITDTLHYSTGEMIKAYHGIEPRFSLNYSLGKHSAVKLGYNRNRQYIHLISNTTTVSPTDLWKSSNTYIRPQIGDQVSLGYFRNFLQNTIETSVEGYYKHIQNLPDYKNGANLYLNPALEADLLAGKGRAYGIEASINKKAGHLTGWLSYTYARTEVAIQGAGEEETVNSGAWYPASYDKPHTLNMVSSYQPRKRVIWSANFTYSTGRPITAPVAHYVIGGFVVPDYSQRNQYRIPAYHRLDVSMTILPNPDKKQKWQGSWNVSVYNLYGRKNPYAVFFKQVYGSPPRAYQLAVVGVPLPSVSYDFTF